MALQQEINHFFLLFIKKKAILSWYLQESDSLTCSTIAAKDYIIHPVCVVFKWCYVIVLEPDK